MLYLGYLLKGRELKAHYRGIEREEKKAEQLAGFEPTTRDEFLSDSHQLRSVTFDRKLDVFEQRVVGDGDGGTRVRPFHGVLRDAVDVQKLQDDADVAMVV